MLEHIQWQLPQPIIMLGDFNTHNIPWLSDNTDARGREVERFIDNHNTNIMNNGAPARILYNTETAIDITMCSSILEADLHWSIAASPGGSDHCPIFTAYEEARQDKCNNMNRWKIWEARWDLYETSREWHDLPRSAGDTCDELMQDIYGRIERASADAIPVTKLSKFYPQPW